MELTLWSCPWPPQVIKRFSTIPVNARENDFYAPYNKLLYSLFPADSNFTVAPQSYTLLDSRDSVNFIIELEVLLEDKPVCFLEIKEPRKIILKSSRTEADNQMRKRMGDLAPICPLDTLSVHSAHGFLFTPMTSKLASFLAPYLPTLTGRPILLHRIAVRTATFWKTKEPNGSRISWKRSGRNAASFSEIKMLVRSIWNIQLFRLLTSRLSQSPFQGFLKCCSRQPLSFRNLFFPRCLVASNPRLCIFQYIGLILSANVDDWKFPHVFHIDVFSSPCSYCGGYLQSSRDGATATTGISQRPAWFSLGGIQVPIEYWFLFGRCLLIPL